MILDTSKDTIYYIYVNNNNLLSNNINIEETFKIRKFNTVYTSDNNYYYSNSQSPKNCKYLCCFSPNELYDNIKCDSFNINSNNIKIFFNKNVLYPRYLLSLFHNISKCNKIEDADYIIYNSEKNFKVYEPYISSSMIINNPFLLYNKENNSYLFIDNIPYKMIKEFNKNVENYNVSYTDYYSFLIFLYDYKIINKNYEIIYTGDYTFIDDSNINLFNIYFNNKNKKYVSQKKFIQTTMNLLPKIDDDNLSNIESLFKSRDPNNIQIAFKLLSNYDILNDACKILNMLYNNNECFNSYYIKSSIAVNYILYSLGINRISDIRSSQREDLIHMGTLCTSNDQDKEFGRNIIKLYIKNIIDNIYSKNAKKYFNLDIKFEYNLY